MNIDLDLLIALTNKKDLPIKKGYSIFLNHISEFKRIETLNYHTTYYKALIPFLEKQHLEMCSQLNTDSLLLYVQYCKQRGNKNTTINKKIAAIKYMLNYLSKLELINMPKIVIDKLPNDEERFKVLPYDHIHELMSVLDSFTPKHKLQILLLMFTGIRRTELVHILISNIHEDYITLDYTKNKKSRNIYLNNEIMQLIPQVIKDNKIYLFENSNHTDCENPDNICNLFKAIYKKTGIKTSPHSLRHTFATMLIEQGTDMESLRLLLGHSDYSMIQRYVHIKNKRLADISTSLYSMISK